MKNRVSPDRKTTALSLTYSLLWQLKYCYVTDVIVKCCMVEKDISKMVRELRSALGLTQEQFAAKVGVTYSTINRWENNKGKPSPLAMLRIEQIQKIKTEQAV